MQQIYRKPAMPKCDCNKVAKQLDINSSVLFSWKNKIFIKVRQFPVGT